jgi:hypothetical protein
MAMLKEIEFIVAISLQPGARWNTLRLLPDPGLNIGNGCNRSRAAIYAQQPCGAGHDMYMSIVEAGDDCFAFTVYELGTPLKEVEVTVGANPDYLPTPHRHQLRTRPLRIHRQDVGIIEDKVCC